MAKTSPSPAAPVGGSIPSTEAPETATDAAPPDPPARTTRPLIPPGSALFRNPTELPVKLVLLDGANRPSTFRWAPNGGENVVPLEYAHLMRNRAPQLVEVDRRPAEPRDEG